MCNFWSCIIGRDGKITWDMNESSHDELIKKSGWKDNKLEDRDFVRVEVVPRRKSYIFSKSEKKWEMVVDEEKTLPEWFAEKRALHKKNIWAAWKKAMSETLWKLDIRSAKKCIDEIKNIKYLQPDGRPEKKWKLFINEMWSAAESAARSAALITHVKLVKHKIDKKHTEHAEAEMNVWKKGYALLCDVNGVMYVYAKK